MTDRARMFDPSKSIFGKSAQETIEFRDLLVAGWNQLEFHACRHNVVPFVYFCECLFVITNKLYYT